MKFACSTKGIAVHRRLLRAIGIALLPLLSASFGADVKEGLPDFSSLSLQELSSVKVTSVSRKQQRLSQVAAAVYVITQEEIHRSGMTNVPDLLRLVPGISVARIDGSKWGVTSRGFNGRFANKLLVLVDGRSLYSPVFSGVCWDMNMPLLDNIEQIEVVRGPGAAVWGANAVSGVINIITKSARETTGVSVSAAGGSTERGSLQVQAGGRLGRDAYYRTYVAAEDHAALQTSNGGSARDGWSDTQAGFRLDGTSRHGDWQFEGDLFRNSRGEASNLPAPENQFSSNTRYGNEIGLSGSLAFEWRRRLSETSDFRVNSSYDDGNRPELGFSQATAGSASLEAQYHFAAGTHHDISLGAGDRRVSETVTGRHDLVAFHPSSLSYQTASAFAQDEIHLMHDRLLLTAGIKIEHDLLGGWQAQPTARALWTPSRKRSVWIAASRAVRTPTFYERTAKLEIAAVTGSPQTLGLPVVASINGSPSFRAEISKDYELGYRAQVSPAFSLDVTGFYTHYDDLRTATAGDLSIVLDRQPYLLMPYTFTNFTRGHAEGGELAVTLHPAARWKLASNYSYLNVHQTLMSSAPEGTAVGVANATPAHQFKVQSYLNLSRTVQFDTHLFLSTRFLAPIYLEEEVLIPNHVRVDVRLGWRIKPRWEVSLVGQDLGSRRSMELSPEAVSPTTYTGRGAYVRNTWRF